MPRPTVRLLLCTIFSGAPLLGAPALAQTSSGSQPGGASDTARTGVGPRGTPVAPSTDPGLAGQSTSSAPSQTGAGPRGTPAAPSTQPGAASPGQPSNPVR